MDTIVYQNQRIIDLIAPCLRKSRFIVLTFCNQLGSVRFVSSHSSEYEDDSIP